MAEWITGLFSSAPGLSRVRPSGLIVMAIGLIIAIVGGICFRGAENRRKSLLVRLIGLLVTAAGTLLAAGLVPDLATGVRKAEESIDSGAAHEKLRRLVEISNS